jgi:hypothetical protein
MMPLLREIAEAGAAALSWLLMLAVAPLARWRRALPGAPWVIAGHRGRMHDDNAGALHDYICRSTSQPIIWVSGALEVTEQLRREGRATLQRGTFASRWAILCAPVLIYSHGEDDLDPALILLRGRTGLRIFLNHSQNHIKAGEYHTARYASLTGLQKRFYEWRVTDFDYLLASSERERANFALSYPHLADRILLGGGAHCDELLARCTDPPGRSLFYFPTFRDTPAGRTALDRVLRSLVKSERLRDWLLAEGLTLHIGAHINSDDLGVTVEHPFEIVPVSRIKEGIYDCQAFISDYSGLLADFLSFDRPTIFFPFDREDYLRVRRLYVPYEEFAYGPLVETADDLVELLVSNRWRDPAPHAARRRFWRREVFPTLEPIYAATNYLAMVALLAPRTAG